MVAFVMMNSSCPIIYCLLFSNGYIKKNDSLQFRITYTDAKNSPIPCHEVAPVTIKMFNYTQASKQQWYSNPFLLLLEYTKCV